MTSALYSVGFTMACSVVVLVSGFFFYSIFVLFVQFCPVTQACPQYAHVKYKFVFQLTE